MQLDSNLMKEATLNGSLEQTAAKKIPSSKMCLHLYGLKLIAAV